MRRTGPDAMRPFGTTIFAEMSALAARTGAINLGQGFPDTDGPAEILQAAKEAIDAGVNQYPPVRGLPVLREAIATHQRHWYGIELHPEREILVTTGATEALSAAVLALVQPGEEIVVLEPYFDVYAATAALTGARLVPVRLEAPDFALDPRALRAAIGPRTRMILLNNPHNPTGRVFTRDELSVVVQVATKHDLLVISDEVYEHLTFDGHQHLPICTFEGMARRTLTVGSAGKTFSLTGWKVGWISGPADLIEAITGVKQYLSFVSGAPFQPAIAAGLRQPRAAFQERAADLGRRREILREGLTSAGMTVLGPEGTAQSGYFLVADLAPLGIADATRHAHEMAHSAGVVAIPMGSFYQDADAARSFLRFAHCKREETLQLACERLLEARR